MLFSKEMRRATLPAAFSQTDPVSPLPSLTRDESQHALCPKRELVPAGALSGGCLSAHHGVKADVLADCLLRFRV